MPADADIVHGLEQQTDLDAPVSCAAADIELVHFAAAKIPVVQDLRGDVVSESLR